MDNRLMPHVVTCYSRTCGGFDMRNITLSIPDDMVERGRTYARQRGVSLNALIREALQREIERESHDATATLLSALSATEGRSGGARWTRDELYDR